MMKTLEKPDQGKWIPEQPTNFTDEDTKKLLFGGRMKKYFKRVE